MDVFKLFLCVVYGYQYLHFLKHYLSAVCFCCSCRRIWLCWDVLYFFIY